MKNKRGYFKVIDCMLDGSIRVDPSWMHMNKTSGDIVYVDGLGEPRSDDPTIHFISSRIRHRRMIRLLKDKKVRLLNPRFLDNDPNNITCIVEVDGVDVSRYFPDYKIKKPSIYRRFVLFIKNLLSM